MNDVFQRGARLCFVAIGVEGVDQVEPRDFTAACNAGLEQQRQQFEAFLTTHRQFKTIAHQAHRAKNLEPKPCVCFWQRNGLRGGIEFGKGPKNH